MRGGACLRHGDYLAGELVCYYEGYFKDRPTKFEWNYAMGNIDDDSSLIGYIQPKSNLCAAQLANDCTMPHFDDSSSYPLDSSDKEHLAYVLTRFIAGQMKMTNIAPLDEHKATKVPFGATRDIKAGEELYYNYGIEYWLKLLFWTHQHNEQLGRQLVFLYHQVTRSQELITTATSSDHERLVYVATRLDDYVSLYWPSLDSIREIRTAGGFCEYRTFKD
jgi:hypothetical protein